MSHILNGKAYSRAIRGHTLLSAALTSSLVRNIVHCNIPVHELLSTIDQDLASMDVDNKNIKLDYLSKLFDNLHNGEITPTDVCSSPLLLKLSSQLQERKALLSQQSRTAKLWISIWIWLILQRHSFGLNALEISECI